MYNRLFTKILDSSIWLEKDTTRIVWITLLAAMDEDGFCAFSCNENLSRRANVPMQDLVEALKVLESPDGYNPHDEFEGRRIERVPNGWLVLKAPVYRTMMSREIQREQTRIRVAEHRAKKENVTNKTLQNVTVTNVTPQSISKQSTAEQNKAEDIYSAYPLKVKKPSALKAINKALKTHAAEFLLQKTREYAEVRNGDTAYMPHPATWFNNQCFNDHPDTWVHDEKPGKPRELKPWEIRPKAKFNDLYPE